MTDIDAEFRKVMGQTMTSSTAELTSIDRDTLLADLRRIRAELGPPPPKVRLSKHAPAFVEAKPKASPSTDDMRQMCEDIGPQKVPGGFRLKSLFGDFVVLNPVHVKEGSCDGTQN